MFNRLAGVLWIACACWLAVAAPAHADAVSVSAAVSLKETLTQVGRDFESKTGDTVKLNLDASGKLAAQIAQGAPVDVFVSAGTREVDRLVKAGQADAAGRCVVAGNALVLVVPAAATGGPTSLADLATTTGKVAMGDPASVPAGHYAEQTLATLKLGDAVAPRRVLCQNVRQVLAYVARGEVAAGLVYATDAKESGDAVRVVATADPATHDPIEYPAVTITNSAHPAAAKRFLEYLTTPAARAVFTAHGFTEPVQRTRP